MAKNESLRKANIAKNDEFYTRIEDINKELFHYERFFKDKIVFCNCDDPTFSNFFKYFQLNFYRLGLKKLICTHYEYEKSSYKLEIERQESKIGQISFIPKEVQTPLKENGDFRSEECIELLKEADIVVTNPPFSLFNEYIAQLVQYQKKFVILGNPNSIHYKNIFPLVKNNKIWTGYKTMGSDMYFIIPDKYKEELLKNNKEGSGYKTIDGEVYGRTRAIWYTNLDVSKRHENMILYKHYDEKLYKKYENYDAIEVSKVAEIPCDYDGLMGVPDNFLDFYNPDQFEIVGYGRGDFIPEIGTVPKSFLDDYHKNGGKGHVTAGMKSLCYYDLNNTPKFPYSRIIIRRRKKNGD